MDTDVVVLATSAVPALQLAERWVAFGVGKTFPNIAAHETACSPGPEKTCAMVHGVCKKKTTTTKCKATWEAYKDVNTVLALAKH